MKNLKFLAVVVFLAVTTSMPAQSTDSKSSPDTDDWNTVWVEWNPSTFEVNKKGADDESFTGLSLGYSHAYSLTKSAPLFAEVGLGVQYSFKSFDLIDEYDLDEELYEYMDPTLKYCIISAKAPINLIYSLQIPNSSVSLIPFVGLNLRFNIFGKTQTRLNLSDDMIDYLEDNYGKGWEKELGLKDTQANLFNKKDMGGSDAVWERFQIGWHIGVKARFADNFLVGVSYGNDFSKIAKKTKIATTSISLGYTF